jgi:hypothetical protein
MRARTWTLLVAVTLSGCAHEAPRPKLEAEPPLPYEMRAGNPVCTNTYCPITVTVKAGCIISVSPLTLGIDAKIEDAVLHWTISPRSVGDPAFADKGINPKDNGAWMREFRNGTRVGAKEFTWVDKNKLPGAALKRSYGYNVDVIQDGRPCPRFDPTIVNEY